MIDNVSFYHYEYTFLGDRLNYARNEVMKTKNEYAVLSINEGDEEGYSRRLDIRAVDNTVEEIVAYAKAKLPDEFSSLDEILSKLIDVSKQYPEKEKYDDRTDTEYFGFEKQMIEDKLPACRVWVYTAYL